MDTPVIATLSPPLPTPIRQHPGAHRYANLFEGVRSFGELEARIAALPSTLERGDAFEVFTGLYLSVCGIPSPSAIHYKPFPASIANALGILETEDTGIDSVIESAQGRTAVQAKFRTDRTPLGLTELASFLAVSEQAQTRVVISNARSVSRKTGARSNFATILADSLDALSPAHFDRMRSLLTDRPPSVRAVPRGYQLEAAVQTRMVLEDCGLAQVIMACGTGKTVIQILLAKEMQPVRLLVLVPSLALIRQQLAQWKLSGELDLRNVLIVCSDQDSGKGLVDDEDTLLVSKDEVGAPVSTKPEDICAFLSKCARNSTPLAVFCTYASSAVLARGLPSNFRFQLGVFDEAHRTAGMARGAYATALTDAGIPLDCRAFFTATPRVFPCDGADAEVVCSMDNANLYGPPAYEMSFRKAAESGIICHYKIVVAVVTNADARAAAGLSAGQVLVEGVSMGSQAVACHLAVARAMKDHGLRKGIAFFSRVAHAKQFASKSYTALYPRAFELFAVDGAMATGKREAILRQFLESDCAVVSNARCLAEGVDMPAVDFVAFMAPKRSQVDIVQAIGRALRMDPLNPEKKTGYVVLPLFVNELAGESIASAVERTGFGDIWYVLQALMEQDKALADVINDMRSDQLGGRHVDWTRLSGWVSVSHLVNVIPLETLSAGLVTRIVTDLGDKWDDNFEQLNEFAKSFGHAVPPDTAEFSALNRWAGLQRQFKRNGRLLASRAASLDSIGFQWDPIDPTWIRRLNRYKEIHLETGTVSASVLATKDAKLYRWVLQQQKRHSSGHLPKEKVEMLAAASFKFRSTQVRPALAARATTLQEAIAHYKVHGHCVLPQTADKTSLYARLGRLLAETRNRPGTATYSWLWSMGVFQVSGTPEWENLFAAWRKHRAAGTPLPPEVATWAAAQQPLLERRVDRLRVPIPERYADYFKAEPNQYGTIEYVRRMKPSAMRARLREIAAMEGLADRLLAARMNGSGQIGRFIL